MTKEIIYTALSALLILGVVLIACVKHELNTRRINNVEYVETGIMTFTDNGKDIFIPVFRRAN